MPSKTRNSRSRNSAVPDPQRARAISLGRHARKCAICNHPDREAIDDEFIRWCDAETIRCQYFLPDRSCLYRHAKALGLVARRRRNLRGVAERILEHVDDATITASAVIRAMRLFAHISENGEWFEPPKHTLVTHIHSYAPPGEVAATPSSSTNGPLPAATSTAAPPSALHPDSSTAEEIPYALIDALRGAPSPDVSSAPPPDESFAAFSEAVCKRAHARSAPPPAAAPVAATPPQKQPASQPGQTAPVKPRENQPPVTSTPPHAGSPRSADPPAQPPSATAHSMPAPEPPPLPQPPAPPFVTYRTSPFFPRHTKARRFEFPTEVTVPVSKSAAAFPKNTIRSCPVEPNPSENNSLLTSQPLIVESNSNRYTKPQSRERK